MGVLDFRPTLINNTDPLDFIIYTYESANPAPAIASAFWGSVSQAFMFGVIALASCRYFWNYVGSDGWVNVTIVTVLLAVTVGDFIHHQYISYLVISHTNPITGAGIAAVYETYWRGAFIESYMVAVTQPIIVGYFIGRCYGLCGRKRFIIYLGAFAVVLMFVEGIAAATFSYTQAAIQWDNGAPNLMYAMRHIPEMIHYVDKGYKMMSVWLLSSTIIDAIIATTLFTAMYRHRRTADQMRNMAGVRNALQRGMLYVVESMALVVANQIAQTVILMSGLGLSRCLRAVICTRMPLGTFAVLWSLNSRADLKAMLDNATDIGPISFSVSGSFGKGKSSGRVKSTLNDSVGKEEMELGAYGSMHSLVSDKGLDVNEAGASSGQQVGFGDDRTGLNDAEKLKLYGKHFGAKQ